MATSVRKFATSATAFALVLGAPLMLSGCGSNPVDNAPKGGVEGTDNGATGSDTDVKEVSLPDDFPADIPVPEGTIEFGTSTTVDTGTTWILKISSDDPATFEKIQSQMADAGFEEITASVNENRALGSYQGHGYVIVVGVTDQDGKKDVSFSATKPNDDE